MEGEIMIPYDDPMIIDCIGMPRCFGRIKLSERTLARLAAQPEPPSDVIVTLPKEMMNIDTTPAPPGVIKGPGYSIETFSNHPNNGMHYVHPPARHSVSLPEKTPEQLKAQAESIEARLAAARAAKAAARRAAAAAPPRERIVPTTGEEEAATGSKLQVGEVPVLKRREDPNLASSASSGDN